MDSFRIDEIARRLLESVPPALRTVQKDLESNFRAVLREGLSKLDLVNRDEFDAQSKVLERTRDHSHVEVLLRDGLITEAEVHGHPMRNYVECCIGGDAALPEMSISTRRRLKSGDVLLLCTDGLWANLEDEDFVRFAQTVGKPLREALTELGTRAVAASAPYSDNTSAAALRWRVA